jgi:hypothetical protein
LEATELEYTIARHATPAEVLAEREAAWTPARIKSLTSIAGRVGYTWDHFLGYVKAGGASVDRQ